MLVFSRVMNIPRQTHAIVYELINAKPRTYYSRSPPREAKPRVAFLKNTHASLIQRDSNL